MSDARYRLSDRWGGLLSYHNTAQELVDAMFASDRLSFQVYDLEGRHPVTIEDLLRHLFYAYMGYSNNWTVDHEEHKFFNQYTDWHSLVSTDTGFNLTASPTARSYFKTDSSD